MVGGKSGVSAYGLAVHEQINFGGWLTVQRKRTSWNRHACTVAACLPEGGVIGGVPTPIALAPTIAPGLPTRAGLVVMRS